MCTHSNLRYMMIPPPLSLSLSLFLSLSLSFKISDFGLARKADAHAPHEEVKFPVKWTAPEGLKDKVLQWPLVS